MMFVVLLGIPFGIVYNDFSGYLQTISMHCVVVPMLYVGTPYNGLVKKMGVPHGITLGVAVVYNMLRIAIGFDCDSSFFCEQITYDNKPGLFIYLIIFLITFVYCVIQDFIDAYVWYIKGDHIVMRSLNTCSELKRRGLLAESVGQIQVIQTDHNRANNVNKYGYIVIVKNQKEEHEEV
eukprot:UN05977